MLSCRQTVGYHKRHMVSTVGVTYSDFQKFVPTERKISTFPITAAKIIR